MMMNIYIEITIQTYRPTDRYLFITYFFNVKRSGSVIAKLFANYRTRDKNKFMENWSMALLTFQNYYCYILRLKLRLIPI